MILDTNKKKNLKKGLTKTKPLKLVAYKKNMGAQVLKNRLRKFSFRVRFVVGPAGEGAAAEPEQRRPPLQRHGYAGTVCKDDIHPKTVLV